MRSILPCATSRLVQCGKKASSLDHLVGDGEHLRRNFDVKYLRSLEVDHQLELGRLDDRQFTRLHATENFSSIESYLLVCVPQDCSRS